MNSLRHPYRWSIGVLVLGILMWISLPTHAPQEKSCQTKSLAQMRQIATAIELYQLNNAGKPPARLSELVPTYIQSVSIFYLRCGNVPGVKPPNDDFNPKLIDMFSLYDLTMLTDGRVVVYERVPMWSDHKMSYCVTSKGTAIPGYVPNWHVLPDEFRTKYLQDFKP